MQEQTIVECRDPPPMLRTAAAGLAIKLREEISKIHDSVQRANNLENSLAESQNVLLSRREQLAMKRKELLLSQLEAKCVKVLLEAIGPHSLYIGPSSTYLEPPIGQASHASSAPQPSKLQRPVIGKSVTDRTTKSATSKVDPMFDTVDALLFEIENLSTISTVHSRPRILDSANANCMGLHPKYISLFAEDSVTSKSLVEERLWRTTNTVSPSASKRRVISTNSTDSNSSMTTPRNPTVNEAKQEDRTQTLGIASSQAMPSESSSKTQEGTPNDQTAGSLDGRPVAGNIELRPQAATDPNADIVSINQSNTSSPTITEQPRKMYSTDPANIENEIEALRGALQQLEGSHWQWREYLVRLQTAINAVIRLRVKCDTCIADLKRNQVIIREALIDLETRVKQKIENAISETGSLFTKESDHTPTCLLHNNELFARIEEQFQSITAPASFWIKYSKIFQYKVNPSASNSNESYFSKKDQVLRQHLSWRSEGEIHSADAHLHAEIGKLMVSKPIEWSTDCRNKLKAGNVRASSFVNQENEIHSGDEASSLTKGNSRVEQLDFPHMQTTHKLVNSKSMEDEKKSDGNEKAIASSLGTKSEETRKFPMSLMSRTGKRTLSSRVFSNENVIRRSFKVIGPTPSVSSTPIDYVGDECEEDILSDSGIIADDEREEGVKSPNSHEKKTSADLAIIPVVGGESNMKNTQSFQAKVLHTHATNAITFESHCSRHVTPTDHFNKNQAEIDNSEKEGDESNSTSHNASDAVCTLESHRVQLTADTVHEKFDESYLADDEASRSPYTIGSVPILKKNLEKDSYIMEIRSVEQKVNAAIQQSPQLTIQEQPAQEGGIRTTERSLINATSGGKERPSTVSEEMEMDTMSQVKVGSLSISTDSVKQSESEKKVHSYEVNENVEVDLLKHGKGARAVLGPNDDSQWEEKPSLSSKYYESPMPNVEQPLVMPRADKINVCCTIQ